MRPLCKPSMARSLVWLWTAWLLLAAFPAKAHLFDEDGVYAFLTGVQVTDSGTQSLSVLLLNNTPQSITLRGIMTREGDPALIERKTTFLWTDVMQPVKFLQLSQGEQAYLSPPDYLITLPGATPNSLMSGRTILVADFGPQGQVDFLIAGPLGGLVGSPFQTTE